MKQLFKKCTAWLLGLTTAWTLSICAMPSTLSPAMAATRVPAFPGAVGGGKYTTGGRGGTVVHVTNLNDSGAGSFRDAVSQPNRIVVFDVSGTIELAGNILVSDNVTIAGQTAPGGSGITLKNYKLGMSGDNIICRYLSSRPGPYKATSSGNDAWGGAKGSHSIIDHCSMSWTTDEQWGLYSNNEYYTVQYSIIGPADSWGGHSKGIHGFGLMMGKGFSTFDHNLIIHNVSRNFRGKVVGTSTADFTNNVIYNWAYQTAYGTIGHLNYVNNTLKMGNGTTGGKHYISVDSSTSPENFRIFLGGNRMLNKDDSIYHAVTDDNWAGVSVKSGLGITLDGVKSSGAFATTVDGENVSTATTAESASDSYQHVLQFAGNGISETTRTAVDQQAAYDAKTGTGNLSGTAAFSDADASQQANLQKYNIQCGVTYTYPSAVLQTTITDSDHDGMPDEWEIARGLNPKDASDTNGDYCGQGYTNIEYYINDLTVDSFPAGVVTVSPETKPLEIPALQGNLIRDLQVRDTANYLDWKIGTKAEQGALVYGDRDVTYTALPTALLGAEYIQTACDSKNSTDALAAFHVSADATVYVALDRRVTLLPAWLSDWEITDQTVENSSGVTYTLLRKTVSKDTVLSLGSNGQSTSCVNYTVFVTNAVAPSVRGDVNFDGRCNLADAVLLQKYLLRDAVLTSEQATIADFDENAVLDGRDLSLLKRLLFSIA